MSTQNELRRRARMTVAFRLNMQQLAVLKEALARQRKGIDEAVEPFGLVSTWEAASRVMDVQGEVTAARCALKRKQGFSPIGDPECENTATDAEFNAVGPVEPTEPEVVA